MADWASVSRRATTAVWLFGPAFMPGWGGDTPRCLYFFVRLSLVHEACAIRLEPRVR